MNDLDLNALKSIKTPEPASDAKSKALNAALSSFDNTEQEKTVNQKKSSQGIPDPLRLITIFLTTIGEWIMKRSLIIGSATTAVIAVPVALFLYANHADLDFSPKKVEEAAPKSSEQKPQKPEPLAEAKRTTPQKSEKRKAAEKAVSRVSNLGSETDFTANQPSQKPKSVADAKTTIQPNTGTKGVSDSPLGPLRVDLSLAQKRDNNKSTQDYRFDSLANFGGSSFSHPTSQQRTSGYRGMVAPEVTQGTDRFQTASPQQPGDRFESKEANALKSVSEHPVSTFSIDVDTASYAYMRRALKLGRIPNPKTVRVEELINYFNYNYKKPDNKDTPFKTNVSVYKTPWNKNTKLLHIGIKGFDHKQDAKPRANLVFLIDVSGSMQSQDKLPLLKNAFKLLINRLEPEDTVAIVTYAGHVGTALEPTKVSEKSKILKALDNLKSGGATAGKAGIQQAYALAKSSFVKEGVNRVILATDGDFNVGMSSTEQLKTYISKERESGVFLSVMGFGMGNYNDAIMQTLAQNGNGAAAYIDTLMEAQKVLVQETGSTLFPIAKDVKIQIEFNPAVVAEYRLIGYETRTLKRQDFNNDQVDAGDIGSGHSVTAIYEITPVGSKDIKTDAPRYPGNKRPKVEGADTNEYAFLKIRYKLPKEDKSRLISTPITKEHETELNTAPADIKFAASVAAFGQKLRNNIHLKEFTYDNIIDLASQARGVDAFGYRSEFLRLINLVKSLDKQSEKK